MSDTIPTPVDLLRLAYGASDELDVWLDEHLPAPDLGPVTPDTPWGSLCRYAEDGEELTYVGQSPERLHQWAGESSSGLLRRCVYVDHWRVIRSGPEPGPLGTNVGDPITPDTPIGTWVDMAHRDHMTQVSKHGTGDDGLRWWDTEGHRRGYGDPRYTVADPAEVEQWQAQQ